MKETAQCRVCGKPFVPCNKTSEDLKAFNYRCCACSPECGAEYLRRVMEAREVKAEKSSPNIDAAEQKAPVAKKPRAKK